MDLQLLGSLDRRLLARSWASEVADESEHRDDYAHDQHQRYECVDKRDEGGAGIGEGRQAHGRDQGSLGELAHLSRTSTAVPSMTSP